MRSANPIVQVENVGDATVVTILDRKLTGSEQRARVHQTVAELIAAGRYNLVFDLRHVEFLGTEMLQVLLIAKKRAAAAARESAGGDGASESIRLERARVFEIFADRGPAVAAFSDAQAASGGVVLCQVSPAVREVFRVCGLAS